MSERWLCSYCGDLSPYLRSHGRIIHKEACPHRQEPYHQGAPNRTLAEMVEAAKQEERDRILAAIEAVRVRSRELWTGLHTSRSVACLDRSDVLDAVREETP